LQSREPLPTILFMATPRIDLSPSKIAAKISASQSRVKVEDLAETLIRRFGGLEQFAAKYVADYDAAKMGSVTRARLLDGAMKLMQFVGKKESSQPLDEISDEDLQHQIQEALELTLKAIPIKDMTAEGADNGTPPQQ
jgi:hypothetical protein